MKGKNGVPPLPVVHSPSEIAEAIIKHAEEREGELIGGAKDELANVREALERMERR